MIGLVALILVGVIVIIIILVEIEERLCEIQKKDRHKF